MSAQNEVNSVFGSLEVKMKGSDLASLGLGAIPESQ
jgi:hypothetical protein